MKILNILASGAMVLMTVQAPQSLAMPLAHPLSRDRLWFKIQVLNPSQSQPVSAPAPIPQPTQTAPTPSAQHPVNPPAVISALQSSSPSAVKDGWVALLLRFGNVISVFLAAGLAFLAAQYNERKSWQRRKAEQLRGEQFSKIVDGAKALNAIVLTFSLNNRKLEKFKQIDQSTGSQRHVARAEAFACCRAWAVDLEDKIHELQITRMELKLLKTAPGQDQLLTGAIAVMQATYDLLENYTVETDMAYLDAFAPKESNLAKVRNSYVETAIDALGN